MPTFSCSAVLFDLDGVLVDSTRSVDRQWRLWAREQGVDMEKVAAFAHGVRTIEVIRQVAPQLDAAAEANKLEAREAADHDGVSVMPGAAELVGSIPRARWCVVTSGTRRLATARLQLAGIEVPSVVITAEDVTAGKPDAAPYLKGAELLGFPARECLVIEDAPAGIQSAHAAGMMVIALTSTFSGPALSEADAVIRRLDEIQIASNDGQRLSVTIR
jgi:mannitol-1-/sugar-/sorbitol-6-phosphatase